jgi:hypothetical protein
MKEYVYAIYRYNKLADTYIQLLSVWSSFRIARCVKRHINKLYKIRHSMYRAEVTGVGFNYLSKYI